jgi:hypothetical protein
MGKPLQHSRETTSHASGEMIVLVGSFDWSTMTLGPLEQCSDLAGQGFYELLERRLGKACLSP